MKKMLYLAALSLALSSCSGNNPYPVVQDTQVKFKGQLQGTGGEGQTQGAQTEGLQQPGTTNPQEALTRRLQEQQQMAQQQQLQQQQAPLQQPRQQPQQPVQNPQKPPIPQVSTMTVTTSQGDIVIDLLPEKAPQTIRNYTEKADSGYWDNLFFHRVEDWVIQGGDPKGNGTGGGTMPTEISDVPFTKGSAGVARGGNKAESNDSQFFICISDCGWLTGEYTLFGQVSEGMEVAENIKRGDIIESVRVE